MAQRTNNLWWCEYVGLNSELLFQQEQGSRIPKENVDVAQISQVVEEYMGANANEDTENWILEATNKKDKELFPGIDDEPPEASAEGVGTVRFAGSEDVPLGTCLN